jgi:hypothetical protein
VLTLSAGKRGTQLVIPYRGDEMHFRHLRQMGDIGQVTFMVCDMVTAAARWMAVYLIVGDATAGTQLTRGMDRLGAGV